MIYKKYIFKSNLLYSTCICAILIFLIWFSRVSSFVGYITENGIEISKFLNLFILILPWLMIIIIPISLFAGTLFNFNRLKASNEISILKNSGLTKLQICQPVIILAIICSLFCYLIAFFLMPYSNRVLKKSRSLINDNYSNISIKSQTFENIKDLTIYSKRRDDDDNLFEIILHDKRSSDYNLTITARAGKILVQNKSAFLKMEQGTVQKFNYENKNTEIIEFDSYIFNLNENTKINNKNKLKANEYYFYELFYPPADLNESELNKIKIEINERIIDPLLSIVLTLIAISFNLKGEFKRNGNSINIFYAIITATIYLLFNMISYNYLKYNIIFSIIPYINCILFISYSLYLLTKNYRINNARQIN